MNRLAFAILTCCLLQIGSTAKTETFSKDVELNLDVLDVGESIDLREPSVSEKIDLIPPEPALIEDVEEFAQDEATELAEEVEATTPDEVVEEYVDEEEYVDQEVTEEATEEATDIVPEESEVSEEEIVEEYEEEVTDTISEEELAATSEDSPCSILL